MIKGYSIDFKGYLIIDARNEEEAFEKAAEILQDACGYNYEILQIEQEEEDGDYYADRY